MKAYKLLSRAHQHGISITPSGDHLLLQAPEQPPDELLDELKKNKQEIIQELSIPTDGRWNSDYALQGYVWCLDCKYYNGTNCNQNDNPFKTVLKQPLAPRKCQWFDDSK